MSFPKLLWLVFSFVLFLFLVVIVLLWRPFSFTFNYLGILALFFSVFLLALRTMIYSLFEGVLYSQALPGNATTLFLSFIRTVLESFTNYALYIFLVSVILIVLGVYFAREAKRNKMLN